MFKKLKTVDPKLVIALDIETCREYENFTDAPESVQLAFKYFIKNEGIAEEDLRELQFLYEQKAAFRPEFSKVVSISVAFLSKDGQKLLVQNWTAESEAHILSSFKEFLDRVYRSNPKYQLAAHYQLFDLPFLCKRSVINGISPHTLIDNSDSKPWLISTICTHDFWKMGGTASASLSAICAAFSLPSPKGLMDGSEVAVKYFKNQFKDIGEYCNADTISVFWIIQKWKGVPITEEVQCIPNKMTSDASDTQAVAQMETVPENTNRSIPKPLPIVNAVPVEMDPSAEAEFEAMPPLKALYTTKDFSEEIQSEIRELFLNPKKKVMKKEWPMLQEWLTRLYIQTAMFKADKESVAAEKEEEVIEFVEQLKLDRAKVDKKD